MDFPGALVCSSDPTVEAMKSRKLLVIFGSMDLHAGRLQQLAGSSLNFAMCRNKVLSPLNEHGHTVIQ